jgi:putative membrane protein
MNKPIVATIAGAIFSTSVTFSTLALAQGTTPDAKGTVQSPSAADVMPNAPGIDHRSKGKLNNGEFIEKAGMAGLAEIKLSNLALDKSNTPVVREFANLMVKDHTAANLQLKKAATSSGISLPQGVDPAHTELLQKLAGLSGREFDAAYVNVMKQDHDTAIALFENAAGDQSLKPELRDFASKALETLRSHQLQAHNLPNSPGTGPQK